MWDATEPGPNNDPPGDLGQFMVFRSGPTNQALAVAHSISGTATNGVDYTELPGSITIPAGEESALISIEALYDDLAEFDETVTLTLELTGEYLIDPAYCEATVTIQSNAFVAVAELDGPVGIDYHGPLDSLIVSYNYATGGNPRNFARIDSNGQVTPWSLVSNLLEEVKVATAKQTASGWQQGQLYFGTSLEGQIGRVSGWNRCDVDLGDFASIHGRISRGGLTFDQTGIFGGDLIAVTGGTGIRAGHAGQSLLGIVNNDPQEAVYLVTAGRNASGRPTRRRQQLHQTTGGALGSHGISPGSRRSVGRSSVRHGHRSPICGTKSS